MATPSMETVQNWQGRTMVGQTGDKIGTIADIYLDADTGQPEWATVTTGMFGNKQTFVPLAEARAMGDDVQVPYDKSQVKDAPNMAADGQLSQDDEAALYRHYGLNYTENRSGSGLPAGTAGRDADRRAGAGDRDTVGRDTSGPTTDSAMTRSEEELRVSTRERDAGRVRLHKYVVTEDVTTTVPVRHEEVRLEREPITDANRAMALDGPELTEAEHEVVLHAEEPVVEKRVVPKERVRLDKETVTDQQEVSDTVRKERVEVDTTETGKGRRPKR